MRIRTAATDELTPAELASIRELLWAAFTGDDAMTEEDWQHALGGVHVLAESGEGIVGHAAVVERTLYVAGRPLRTGYVEAVATSPAHQRRGIGTDVMRVVGEWIVQRYELGALGTGSQGFYERLGWQIWRGPSFVRTGDREHPTPDEDGYILVLRTPRTPPLDAAAPIACEWRPGDAW